MKHEPKKHFDISKPRRLGPDPTSKPIIVGHHPTMPDPMIREQAVRAPRPINITDADTPQPVTVTPTPESKPELKVLDLSDLSSPSEPSAPRSETTVPVGNEEPASSTTIPITEPQPSHTFNPTAPPQPEQPTSPVSPDPLQPPTSSLPPEPAVPDPPTATSHVPVPAAATPQTPAAVQPAIHDEVHIPAGHDVAVRHKPRLWVWAIVTLILLAWIYAAVDALTEIKLPIEFFKKEAKITETQRSSITPPSAESTQPTMKVSVTELADGRIEYKNETLGFKFAYPKDWGNPIDNNSEFGNQEGYVHYEFAEQKGIKIASFPKNACPQGDGGQISTAQGWYEKNAKFYVTWCKNSPECIRDPQCGNNTKDYEVGFDDSKTEKINTLTLLNYDFSIPDLTGESNYAQVEGLFNLTKNDKYSGLSLVRVWTKEDKLNNQTVLEEFKAVLNSYREL